MQHWTDTCPIPDTHPIIPHLLQEGDLFLDIETTGLSRTHHRIYLIGMAAVVDHNIIYVNQLFADSPDEEAELLSDFSKYLQSSQIRRIVTFNGSSFDLPFLVERAKSFNVPLDLDTFELFDIYKEVTKRKSYLKLQNYRQKTVEQFLGICREDQYSGGELIQVYQHYVKQPDVDAVHLLKLHNYEDVLGMFDLLAVFAYDALFTSPAQVTAASVETYTDMEGNTAQELILSLTPPYPLSGTLSCKHPVTETYVHAHGNIVRLRIPLYHGMARMYYLDYKNYYYLTDEDMAIHKSVAAYVDKSHRKKATPENCYTGVAITNEFLHSDKLAEYVTHVLRNFYPFSKKNDLSRINPSSL